MDTFHPIKINSLLFFSFLTCYRKRQANAAAAGNNIDDVKTFTVPCNIDVQLDKATVIRHDNYCYYGTVFVCVNGQQKSQTHANRCYKCSPHY